jgi:phosphoglycolate phosphatase
MFQTVLFDLDGTLTRSEEGIIRSVQYALAKMGRPVPPKTKLIPFIGPPLVDSFRNLSGLSETDALKATSYYRERFTDTGIFENELYPGVLNMLGLLQSKGVTMATASAKPEVFVRRIVDHFGLTPYFREVAGASFDASRRTKTAVILDVLKRLKMEASPEKVLMVGDTAYDVEGARKAGVPCLCVTYGYGKRKDIMASHPAGVVSSVEAVGRFILGQ